ncbi:ATP-grasp ribosomal peptide maturase [Streptomyces sp. NPDC096153]|uniref:ATP-grasp ribosomal peptide maturase n=1 Tax=Streptomyces sp. NPDC096153 TaxID=3155548 RepID=UPI00331FAC42
MSVPVVLVLTGAHDITADLVVAELNRRNVPVFRCDPGDLPRFLTFDAQLTEEWQGGLKLPNREVSLAEIGCVYYRRPGNPEYPEFHSEAERRWAQLEVRKGFYGVIRCLPNWLNHPHAVEGAEYKPIQLRAAVECGIKVPSSLITNCPEKAQKFAANHGKVVYKSLGVPTFREGNEIGSIYTRLIDPAEIDDSLRLTLHLFQEWVPKSYEVRLTVVDDKFFAARIDTDSAEARIDWRSDYDSLRYTAIGVPADVRASISKLMAKLDLRFSALDFIVDEDGQWVLVDVNPNGQWSWIEAVALPIASAICDSLTSSFHASSSVH